MTTYDTSGNPTTPPAPNDPDASVIRVHIDGGSPGGYRLDVAAWGSSDAPAGVYANGVLVGRVDDPNAPTPRVSIVGDARRSGLTAGHVADVWRAASDAFGRVWSAAVAEPDPDGSDPATWTTRPTTDDDMARAGVPDHVRATADDDPMVSVVTPGGFVVGIVHTVDMGAAWTSRLVAVADVVAVARRRAYIVRPATAADVMDYVDAERFGDVTPDAIAADTWAVVVPRPGYPTGYVVGIVGPGGPAPTAYYADPDHDPAAIVAAARAHDPDTAPDDPAAFNPDHGTGGTCPVDDPCPACGYGPMPSNPAAARARTIAESECRPCPTCGIELDPDAAADGRIYVVAPTTDDDMSATPAGMGATPAPGDATVRVPAGGYPSGVMVAIIDADGGTVWAHPDHDDGAANAAAARWRMEHGIDPDDPAGCRECGGPHTTGDHADDAAARAGWTVTDDPAAADTPAPNAYATPRGVDVMRGDVPRTMTAPDGVTFRTVRGITAGDMAELRTWARAVAAAAATVCPDDPMAAPWLAIARGDDGSAFGLSTVYVVTHPDGADVGAVVSTVGGGPVGTGVIVAGPHMPHDRDTLRAMDTDTQHVIDALMRAGGIDG